LPSTLVAILALVVVGAAGCEEPRSGPPDIVLVVLDTVRDDYTALGGAAEEATPNLAALAGSAVYFSNAWANAPWTVPSHASMLTGKLPSAHGCTSRIPRLAREHPTLAEKLAQAGYTTAAFFSNPWLADRSTGLLRGFAVRRESPLAGFGDSSQGVRGDQGGRSTDAAVRGWLQGLDDDQPMFLFVNYLEAHLPYAPAEDYRRRKLNDLAPDEDVSVAWAVEFNAGLHGEKADWARVRRLYAGDVHRADHHLGQLLRGLDEAGRLEDAVLIVTSDHGENLGDHGLMEHQFSIHETLLDVPLIIRAPRLGESRRDDPVMLVDLYPTILELAGLAPESPAGSPARSLLAGLAPQERPVIAEYAGAPAGLVGVIRRLNPENPRSVEQSSGVQRTLRQGSLRLTDAGDGRIRLHDMAEDTAQQHDLSESRSTEVERLMSLLEAHSDLSALQRIAESEIDPETAEKLRSLGYVR